MTKLDETHEIIRRNWNKLLDGVAQRKDPEATKWYGLLKSSYTEEHRAYHTLEHIAALLKEFEILEDQFEAPKTVLAAIFFHDIVYATAIKDADGNLTSVPAAQNEKKSARIARMALSDMGFDRAFAKRTAALINATAAHKCDDVHDKDMLLFLDMDMAILGANPQRYKEYCTQVRKEFFAYDDMSFMKGRLGYFVKPTMENPPIFKTKYYQEKLEQQARANLMQEARDLESMIAQNASFGFSDPSLKPKKPFGDK
jgi:predicted metal-dependent HD superfamily phosphohydrolase